MDQSPPSQGPATPSEGARPETLTATPPGAPPRPPAVPSSSSRRKWLWGCGGCGCLLVVLVAVLVAGSLMGGLFGGLFGQLGVAKQTATAFAEAMKSGDYDTAYDYLSAARQREVSRQDFASMLESNSGLAGSFTDIKSYSLNNLDLKNDRAVVKGSVTLDDGSTKQVSFFLVQESGKWKIEKVEGLD